MASIGWHAGTGRDTQKCANIEAFWDDVAARNPLVVRWWCANPSDRNSCKRTEHESGSQVVNQFGNLWSEPTSNHQVL